MRYRRRGGLPDYDGKAIELGQYIAPHTSSLSDAPAVLCYGGGEPSAQRRNGKERLFAPDGRST
jgi:hypothetical protein